MESRKILETLEKLITPSGIVFLAAFSRLIPHPPNFAPIGAISLFSGANLKGPLAFLIPLSAMFLSDVFIGFHNTMPYVYGSFLLIVLIGKFIRKDQRVQRLIAASLSSSLIFYLITNFGVWAQTQMYPKTPQGLIQSYILGLPFLRNTLLGDFFYTFSLFWGYAFFVSFLQKIWALKAR